MATNQPIATLPRPEPNTSRGRVLAAAGTAVVYECCGPGWPDDDTFAAVLLNGCVAHRLGGPNDEARPIAPGIGCHEVVESSWPAEYAACCFAVRGSDDVRPRLLAKRHFQFVFKENEFHCLADECHLLTCVEAYGAAVDAALRAVRIKP